MSSDASQLDIVARRPAPVYTWNRTPHTPDENSRDNPTHGSPTTSLWLRLNGETDVPQELVSQRPSMSCHERPLLVSLKTLLTRHLHRRHQFPSREPTRCAYGHSEIDRAESMDGAGHSLDGVTNSALPSNRARAARRATLEDPHTAKFWTVLRGRQLLNPSHLALVIQNGLDSLPGFFQPRRKIRPVTYQLNSR